jgi:hypothetical protein
LGPDIPIPGPESYLTQVGGIAVGYSTTSHRFLVAYMTKSDSVITKRSTWPEMRVQLVSSTGTLVGSAVRIAGSWARDPSIAWNSSTDEFAVAYSLEPTDSHYLSGFSIVSPSNAQMFHSWTFNGSATGRTTWTSLDYNASTNRYVMVWWEGRAKAAEITATGSTFNVLKMGTSSFIIGKDSYDGLSAALNPVSGTIWLVGMMGNNDSDVGGLELNGHGVALGSPRIIGLSPVSNGQPLAQNYVRVASSSASAAWLAVYNRSFQTVMVESTRTTTTGGGNSATFADYTEGSAGSGSSGSSGGISTPPPATCSGSAPASNFVCVGSSWVPCDHPMAVAAGKSCSAPPPVTTPPPHQSQGTSTPPPATCSGSAPVSGWVCVGDGWLPPDHPGAIAYLASHSGGASQGSTAPPPSNPYAPCVTPPPGSGWVCTAQGNWLPPDNPNAIPALPTCSSSYGTPPVAGWVRVGDGWLPPDHPGAVNAICKAP